MRTVILLLMALTVLGCSAMAQNPDGPAGSIWLEASGDLAVSGSWEFPSPLVYYDDDKGDRNVAILATGLGVVASERVTFSVNLRYEEAASEEQVVWRESAKGAYNRNEVMVGMRVKIWLRISRGRY